jgi:hypothetical protein
MLNLQFLGADAALERVKSMLQKIDHAKRVDLGNELSAWQTEDLNRNRPFTMRRRARGQASTVIRPHSLHEVKRSVAYQRGQGRRIARTLAKTTPRAWKRATALFRRFQPRTSTRAILRSEMEQVLEQRMHDMVREKISW